MSKPTDLVQGTLDLLILARRIRQVSRNVLQVNQGALYPALHRLEQQGCIKAVWEQANWDRLSAAIGLVLKNA
ncbi:MAG TPA: helix-turn-helix transcriptional regulator [Candidatus Binatia bacterium]|nr:helix-turn-helix transcriptional regulator [Candidatus Binatia bacterium]